MDIKKLTELKKQFLEELNNQKKLAKTEDDYSELESIAEDIMCGIPNELILKDYWTRSAVISRITDEDKQTDTKYINGFMKYLYNIDAVCFDEQVTYTIDDADLEFQNK
jgi:hypothetical protein